MNFLNFYKEANQQLIDAMVSMWASGHPVEQQHLRKMFEREPLVAEPVFQTIFPWEQSKNTFMEHATHLNLLDEAFTEGLSTPKDDSCKDYVFPANRCPYKHQTASWKALLQDKKTIVVTSGTGSGKTECFMIPVLQDLYRQKVAGKGDGVQAIFLYPLNALMKNQQQRIDAWCKSLSPNITYAIYNGDMPESGSNVGRLPQIFTRQELRKNPPQILFTNPTMLNYMMVRSEDQEILKKSKGKLRWILLDEAHTYSGSSAAELALQIRQVLEAFDVTIDQVNFAVTSATIGDPNDAKVREKVISTVSQLTGKPADKIAIITGRRILPQLNQSRLKEELKSINEEFGGSVKEKEIEHLREMLNEKPALKAETIANYFNKKLSKERQLELIDRLATKVPELDVNGEEQAILPVRGHFFIRSIHGVFACPNSKCPSQKDDSFDLGSLTTYQNVSCPRCNTHLLEVASCPDCGGLVLMGENSTDGGYRLRVIEQSIEEQLFDSIEDDIQEEDESSANFYNSFVIGKTDVPCPRTTARPSYVTIDVLNNKIHHLDKPELAQPGDVVYREIFDKDSNRILCPHCGSALSGKLHYLRASATFMGRILAATILDNADPIDTTGDRDILYDGRKFIAFTDSRQGTAKSAMTTNQEVERNWIRTAIFHKLAEKRVSKYNPGGSLSEEEQQTYDHLISSDGHLAKMLQNLLDDLKAKMSGVSVPTADSYSWKELSQEIEGQSSLLHLFHHLREAKKNALLSWNDPVMTTDKSDYLNALYFDQFAWIPKRSNSLETMGLVHVVYPPIQTARVPEELGRLGFSDDDWRTFLKICVDYVVRGCKHILILDGVRAYTLSYGMSKPIYGPNCKIKGVPKWPVCEGSPSKVNEKQSRIVLLLFASLGYDSKDTITKEQRALVDGLLIKAWNFIRDNILFRADDNSRDSEDYGYALNLLDDVKVRLQLITTGWACPVDNVIVDTKFRGFSPRMRGYVSKTNFERFKITTDELIYPFFPYANGVDPSDSSHVLSNGEINDWIQKNMSAQKESGHLNQLFSRVYENHQIYLAGEHSAQQQPEILEQYEKDFNKGHMNILSCSTTMEMGVDLKGISAVVMNTVPPKPANYLQRAGRAGRRGESKALALTFCSPSPVGMSAWKNPLWPMEHQTETPLIKLESRQIVQRHVNSFFFAKFIQSRGGIKVRASVGYFFSVSDLIYQDFLTLLEKIRSDSSVQGQFVAKYKALVKGTCMSSVSVVEAAHECLLDINRVNNIYRNRVAALEASLARAQTIGGKALAAVSKRKDSYESSALLPYLAENNFLPSAGIPTGLVEFIPNLMAKGNNQKTPTQHLSQAISAYAPGSQVILNEWNYEPQGILMKSKFEESKKDVLQSCRNCGYSLISIGNAVCSCPQCHQQAMSGLKQSTHNTRNSNFTEIVEPAGFSVDWAYKPNRKLKDRSSMNLVQPLLLKMEPWSERTKNVKICMRTSQPESEILFYNKGTSGHGFALCPYCGRMKSELTIAGDDDDKNPLSLHKHLETGESCEGADNDGLSIRRNVLIVGRYQTDFVEVKFYDKDEHEIIDVDTLYSLGVIISRKLAEVLGVNDGEIDFGYNQDYHSIFIYDTTLGGAGYSPLLREYKNEVLDAAYQALSQCTCQQACTQCLIDRQSQWYLNYLSRPKALEWLEMERDSRKAPDSVTLYFPHASVVTSDLLTEFCQITNSHNLESVNFFIDSDFARWSWEDFPLLQQIKSLKSIGISCNFILAQSPSLSSVRAEHLSTLISLFFNNQFSVGALDIHHLKPLMLLTYSGGHQVLYFGETISLDPNKTWANGKIFVTDANLQFEPLQVQPSALLKELSRDSGNAVFEFSVMKPHVMSSNLFSTLRECESSQWDKVQHALFGKTANIQYADKYVRSPLNCFIVANFIGQIIADFQINVNSLSLSMAPLEPSKDISRSLRNTEFLMENIKTDAERNDLLKKCIEEICQKTPSISSSNSQHFRCLTIETEEYECSIRPDAGFSWGWKLDRASSGMYLDDLTDDLSQDLHLFNFASSTNGILYTVVLKKRR